MQRRTLGASMAVRVRSVVATAVLAPVLALTIASMPETGSAATSSSTNPVADAGGGVKNVPFYYDGSTPLRTGSDLSRLGHPSIVVTTTKGSSGDADAIAAIHSTGAKAYRYVQYYWAPQSGDYDGINLKEHPGWVFCGARGSTPLGRTTDGGATK